MDKSKLSSGDTNSDDKAEAFKVSKREPKREYLSLELVAIKFLKLVKVLIVLEIELHHINVVN